MWSASRARLAAAVPRSVDVQALQGCDSEVVQSSLRPLRELGVFGLASSELQAEPRATRQGKYVPEAASSPILCTLLCPAWGGKFLDLTFLSAF